MPLSGIKKELKVEKGKEYTRGLRKREKTGEKGGEKRKSKKIKSFFKKGIDIRVWIWYYSQAP